jgi:hypothetical protein
MRYQLSIANGTPSQQVPFRSLIQRETSRSLDLRFQPARTFKVASYALTEIHIDRPRKRRSCSQQSLIGANAVECDGPLTLSNQGLRAHFEVRGLSRRVLHHAQDALLAQHADGRLERGWRVAQSAARPRPPALTELG